MTTATDDKRFTIHPLKDKGEHGKEARLKDWPELATRDLEIIAGWQRQFPNANWGVVADEEYCILESDNLTELQKQLDWPLPPTYTVQARENRPHLYFRQTPASRAAGNMDGAGIFEFKQNRKYVVAEGSIHPTGAVYKCVNGSEIPAIPDWLVGELVRLKAGRTGKRLRGRKIPVLGPLAEKLGEDCGRDDDMIRITGMIMNCPDVVDEDQALEILQAHCAVRHEPMYHEEKMRDKIRRGFKDWKRPTKLEVDDSLPREELERRVQVWLEENRGLRSVDYEYLVQGTEMELPQSPNIVLGLRKPKPAQALIQTISSLRMAAKASGGTPYLIPGLIPAGFPHLLVGDSGLGKSPLIAQMMVSLALGKEFLGKAETAQRKVLIVDYENGPQLLRYLETLARFMGRDAGELEEWLGVLDGNQCNEAAVLKAADDWNAELVTVDALRGFRPLAESKNSEAADMLAQLQKQGAAWLLTHHTRKDPQLEQSKRPALDKDDIRVLDWLNAAAGARALVNQSHTRIAIDHAHMGEADLLIRPFVKGLGETGRIYLNRDWGEDGEPQGYTKAEGLVLLSLNYKTDLAKVQGQTLTYGELVERLGHSKQTVKRFLDDCEQAGLVERLEGVVGSREREKKPRYRFGPK